MSAAELITIADALAADLAAHSFSLAPTISRVYVPVTELTDNVLYLLVIGTDQKSQLATRGGAQQLDFTVDIGIRQKLAPPGTNAAIDPLMGFCDEVETFLKLHTPTGTAVTWQKTANRLVFDPALLDQAKEFLSILAAEYKRFG